MNIGIFWDENVLSSFENEFRSCKMAANVLGLKSNAHMTHMSYTGCNLNGHAGASGPCAKGTPRQLVVLLSLFMFFTFF